MYDGEHGVLFGAYHTWNDWHLIPASRPVIAPPKERTKYITVPGMDGSWDYSQAVAQRPVFDDREGSLNFYVENDYWDWNTAYTTILNLLNGKRMTVILDDDASHYYYGACWVDKWKSDEGHSTITIGYRLHPYKKERYSSLEKWKWDTFNFDLDVIREYGELAINGSYTLTVPGTPQPNYATVTATSGSFVLKVSHGETTVESVELQNGKSAEILLGNDLYHFEFTGTGMANVDYRGGML